MLEEQQHSRLHVYDFAAAVLLHTAMGYLMALSVGKK